MRDAGWSCGAHGALVHESGITCNWMADSIFYIFNCLDKAWEVTAASRIQRKGFDIKQFSTKKFHAITSNRGPQQQGLLTAIASGKHVTMDALAHYARDDPTCPFCTCVDSKTIEFTTAMGWMILGKSIEPQ